MKGTRSLLLQVLLFVSVLFAAAAASDVEAETASRVEVLAPFGEDTYEHHGWTMSRKRAAPEVSLTFFVELEYVDPSSFAPLVSPPQQDTPNNTAPARRISWLVRLRAYPTPSPPPMASTFPLRSSGSPPLFFHSFAPIPFQFPEPSNTYYAQGTGGCAEGGGGPRHSVASRDKNRP